MSIRAHVGGRAVVAPMADSAASRVDRRRALLLVLIPMEVLLLAVSVAMFAGLHRGRQPAEQFQQQIAGRAEAVLERSPIIADFGMAAHLHDASAPSRVMCAVEEFGTDPPDATDAAKVHLVYAHHLCAIAQDGLPWDGASKSAGPVVVNLDNGSVWVPQANLDYRTQVQATIPARYLSQAFAGFAHPEVVAELRRRYTAEVGRTN
jgi:hypothetical protein